MASIVSLSDYRRKREVDEALEMLDSPTFKKKWDDEYHRELWAQLKGDLCTRPDDSA